jgi:hypothetical protein
MLSARSLYIVWGDTPRYWRWISVPDSRYIMHFNYYEWIVDFFVEIVGIF